MKVVPKKEMAEKAVEIGVELESCRPSHEPMDLRCHKAFTKDKGSPSQCLIDLKSVIEKEGD